MNKFLSVFSEAWTYRRAWWYTATARTSARFARTTLGSFWLGLSNLLSILSLGFVYGNVFKVADFGSYFIYLAVGLTLWSSFSTAVSSSSSLFANNSRSILNSNIHPIFYTLEEWAFQVQTFAQSFSLTFFFFAIFRHQLFTNIFVALPSILNYLLFLFWLPVLVCCLGIRLHDLYQITPIALQLLFLLSPILYYQKNLGSISWITDYNLPFLYIENVRHALLYGSTNYYTDFAFFIINCLFILVSFFLVDHLKSKLPLLF